MSERPALNPLASQRILAELKQAENSTNFKLPILEAANKSFQAIQKDKEEIIKTKKELELMKEELKETERKGFTDALTGFENRQGLNRFKEKSTNIPEQYPMLMLTFDLDNLKKINDNPDPNLGGHAGGDRYILSFVKFVNELFPDNKKFRLGGDEFLIPISNLDPKELPSIYEKLKTFNQKEQNPNELQFTYETDVAKSSEDFYSALKRSDDKLVEAKKAKKDQQNLSSNLSTKE